MSLVTVMGFFRRRNTRLADGISAPAEKMLDVPQVDPFLGETELAAAKASLLHGSWGDAEALLHQRGNCSRSMRLLSDADVPVETIEAWHLDVDTARTQTLLGNALIRYGWAIRGNGPGASMGLTDGIDFHRVIERAEDVLLESAATDITCPEPWALMLTTGMALGVGQDEIGARFERAHARTPMHAPAVQAMVQASAPKWGGTTIGLKDFAQWILDEAPEGSPALGAVVEAQVEIAADRATDEGVSAMSIMGDSDNIVQAEDALEKLLAGIDGTAPVGSVEALNWLLFWVAPTSPRSADLNTRGFAALQGRVTAQPWERFADEAPVVAFKKIEAHRQRLADTVHAMHDKVQEKTAEHRASHADAAVG